ncbi:MAG: type II toxin-antitoxin system RelE/ParE family toxin [Thermoplasmata archaeon]|nr:type II toxin-antitoxin system RelE/ParE family toxin [Thermoplasmata archaeon]
MRYSVRISDIAEKQVAKLSRDDLKRIYSWIETNLEGCEDPYRTGKPLEGQYKGLWRYRVGDYRIFARISDGELLILIIEVKHRRNAYKG